jgi:curli biogenesis system outer membrane secretion channel CsgG
MAVLATAALQPAFAQKRRVAIMNFEYGTVSTSVAQIFGQNVDIGKGISDVLVDRLVNGTTFTVFERKALDKLMTEQNISNSDRFDPSTAARIGKLVGVEAIIIGSITQFGRDDKKQGLGGIGGAVGGKFGLGNAGRTSSKAVVQITARMISVDTGEILASTQGKGESARSGMDLGGAGGSGGNYGGGGVDMKSSNFGQTIIGEAVNNAVTEMARGLEMNASRIPAKAIVIDALVADVTGSTIIINKGKGAGVKVGDQLTVRRAGKAITDPATGKVLKRQETLLGTLKITEVDDVSATGTFSGTGAAKVGDTVKNN